MDTKWHRFVILYILYDKLKTGTTDLININFVRENNELIFANPGLVSAELVYLIDSGMIGGSIDTAVKISPKGFDIIEKVFKCFLLHLHTISNQDSNDEYNHIIAMPEETRRGELYYYITQNRRLFEEYLFSSEILDRIALSTDPSHKPIITPNRSHEINQFMNHIEKIVTIPVANRIKELEDQYMERKLFFKYDPDLTNPSKEQEMNISKTIAGFMNASGGILFIGVDKDGNPKGLLNDYNIVKNNNQDGFELELRNSVRKYLKNRMVDDLYLVKFHKINNENICEVITRPLLEGEILHSD